MQCRTVQWSAVVRAGIFEEHSVLKIQIFLGGFFTFSFSFPHIPGFLFREDLFLGVHINQDLIWYGKVGVYMSFWVHRGS